MDSTMVHQIADLASKLGVEARTALVWWFLARFAINALWAGVILVIATRGLGILRTVGYGMKLVELVKSSAGGGYDHPTPKDFERASHAIVEAFKPIPK